MSTARGPAPASRIRAYLGLGANVGDAPATLAWAIGRLDATPGLRVRAVSRLYVTTPWGVTDQPDFHNAAVAVETTRSPLDLLATLKTIERDAGRRRRGRWGPRELDLDLLVYGRQQIRVERPPEARSVDAATDPAKAARLLEVPHRDAGERSFVLAPLADLAPRLAPPGWSTTVETRRRRVAASEPPNAVRPVASWDAAARGWRPLSGPGASPGGGSG